MVINTDKQKAWMKQWRSIPENKLRENEGQRRRCNQRYKQDSEFSETRKLQQRNYYHRKKLRLAQEKIELEQLSIS